MKINKLNYLTSFENIFLHLFGLYDMITANSEKICNMHYALEDLEESDFKKNISMLEKVTKNFATKNKLEGLPSARIRIPVVVHVVYNTAAQNIPDEQIVSQVESLNRDYRRLNSDAGNVPPEFLPFAADTYIEFALAVRDPNCNSTYGITRTATSVVQFEEPHSDPFGNTNQPIKHSSQGGHDAWPTDKYLNIWVCNLVYRSSTTGITEHSSGYSQFPAGNTAHDGVVINYDCFGTIGNLLEHRRSGRTATHEIGHWLNLKHIWGRGGQCDDDDEVEDTPRQKGPNDGCPRFPDIVQSCPDTGPNGTMFMNYLDFTYDECMCMFTVGQAFRMRAAIYNSRSSILSSDGLVPPDSLGMDVWSQDTPYDIGEEPNTISNYFWISEDIWVRNNNDGRTNQEHQNPIYRPPGEGPNYVYVRIRNRSCSRAGIGSVNLYWAKSSTSLSWPSPWDGTVTSPAIMGGQIGTINTGSVPPRGITILEFPWNPPNPEDYSSFGADNTHFCLLSRIETLSSPPYGLTEGPDLEANVRNNNKIIWKNVSIIGPTAATGRVMAINYGNKKIISKFILTAPKCEEPSIFEFSKIKLHLDDFSLNKWRDGGKKSSGIKTEGQELYVGQNGATIENIQLNSDEIFMMDFEFKILEENRNTNQVFNFDILHTIKDNKEKVIGGQRFIIKTMTKAELINK